MPASRRLPLQVFPLIVVIFELTMIIPEEDSKPEDVAGAARPLPLLVLLEILELFPCNKIKP